ncbi:MAG TPA: CNNM domain-containing protein [Verrucomicrobiae bacterium]|jgi:CBS domain containing-hemolysin-like protein|nr:CNNM domain-containing protein [Verrucomicrobiae bacterium]
MEHILYIVLPVFVCVVLSFLFSGMEAGVLALNRLRIRQMMRTGDPRATVLMAYLNSPENFLWTILVGNTLANLGAVSLLVFWLRAWLGQWPGLWLVCFLALVFLFYAFCELLPKMLFRMFPNRLTLALAGPFRFIHLVLAPLVALMTKLAQGLARWTDGKTFQGQLFGSREEMRLVMQESAQGLTSDERLMINRVLDLQNLQVREVAIPMERAETITTQTHIGDVLKIARERRVSRLPVWRVEGNQRRIVGVLSLRAVMYQAELDLEKSAADYVKPALYLEEDMRLEAALKRMQRSGQRLAIVLGRDKRETGIVSLQDILKVIFGEVRL